MIRTIGALAGAAMALSFVSAKPAIAETTECAEITTLPTVITVQGVYCLKQHLQTAIASGNAIEIQTNNVIIDFNDFKLGGLAAGPTTETIGVYSMNRRNITLRNGNIRGFYAGVALLTDSPENSSGHLVEDSLFDGNTVVGLQVGGSGVTVRNNRVVNTDSTPPSEPLAHGLGASAESSAASVRKHMIDRRTETTGFAPQAGTGSAVAGIVVFFSTGSNITGNNVSNSISSGDYSYGIGLQYSNHAEISRNTVMVTEGNWDASGIVVADSSHVFVRQNELSYGRSTSGAAIGISKSGITSNIICRDNTVIDFTDGQTSGCDTDSGTLPAVP